MDDTQKAIEELKKEIVLVKVRLRRVEGFVESMPNPERYLLEGIDEGDDPLLEDAKKIVSEYDRVSASLIQRKLSIGYARAVKLLDLLENAGVVGHAEGSKPRQVLAKKVT